MDNIDKLLANAEELHDRIKKRSRKNKQWRKCYQSDSKKT